MKNIINLTPHEVKIIAEDGVTVRASFPSAGVARATQKSEVVGDLNGIELVRMAFGSTEDLPVPAADTFYVVSITTANAAKAEGRGADDLLITADSVRDAEGKIIGCKRFALV